jgi:hypothetical protein
LICRGLTAWEATGAKYGWSVFNAVLADACGKSGDADAGLNAIDRAFAIVQMSKECLWEAELYRVKGKLLLQAFAESSGKSLSI